MRNEESYRIELREHTRMDRSIGVLRNGEAVLLPIRMIVEGDCVLLVGGLELPADIEWLDGDNLTVRKLLDCSINNICTYDVKLDYNTDSPNKFID